MPRASAVRGLLPFLLVVVACRDRPAADPSEPTGAFHVADSLRSAGRAVEALTRYRMLRDSFALAGDSANHWRAQLWWSDAFRRLGRSDSARAGLKQAMRLAGDDRARGGWTHLMLSFTLERDGQLDSAYTQAVQALELAHASRDRELEAYAHDALGTAHSLRGRYREALAADSTSLAIRRALALPPSSIAQSLNEVGIGYRHLGRYTDAVRVYEEALAINRRLGNDLGMAIVAHNLANIRTATGEVAQATRLLHESLGHSERLQHHKGMGLNHNSLATLYLRAGNRPAARSHAELGLRINRSKGERYGEVSALENLGRLELADGRSTHALAALTEALSLADSGGFGRERVSIRAALVSVAVGEDDGARDALRWAKAAKAIADSLGDPEAQFQALEAEGIALEAARRGAALDSYLEAIELLESWRGRLALGDLRMGVAEPRLGVYEGAIRLLLERKRPDQAFEVAERARARLLLELMADRNGSAARSREQELRARLRESYEARTEVKDRGARNRLDREIDDILEELNRLAAGARTRDSIGGPHHRAYAAAELQEGLLQDRKVALLAYFWGDSAVYGWWLGRDSARGARLGTVDSLGSLVSFLHSSIERPNHDSLWRGVARRAYQRLVEPLAPELVEQVLVVTDGPLAHIPLEVLVPGRSAAPWGATARFTYGPSATVLLALLHGPKARGWERAILALGNAAGGAGGVGSPTERETQDPKAPVALPYAGAEARAIHKLFRGSGGDILLGRQATLARWLALDPSRYQYLHFAAHARVSDQRPENTHLVLSGGNLDLAAIRGLRLRADLVTLSACETALGRRVRGEGIIGLPHAFLAAGAQGAVVTLWRIGDRSASNFMREFYQELHAGRGPAAALLAVRQRWIASGGDEAHPSRWAPFILVGGNGQGGRADGQAGRVAWR
ncbi:MAG: CHAT domain-containing protein [Gemmatimonadales bacterium]